MCPNLTIKVDAKLRVVVAMVEHKKSHRILMNSHLIPKPESQAFVAHHHNHSFKGEIQETTTTHCDNCKKEGYSRDKCWLLHLELRPKRKNRDGGNHTKKKGADLDWEKKGNCAVTLDESVKAEAQSAQGTISAHTTQLHTDLFQAQQAQLGNLLTQLLGNLNNRDNLSNNCVQSFLHYDKC
jgi:hypothetical protein